MSAPIFTYISTEKPTLTPRRRPRARRPPSKHASSSALSSANIDG